VWEWKGAELVSSFHPNRGQTFQGLLPGINALVQIPKNVEEVVVCNKSSTVYVMNLKGQVLTSLSFLGDQNTLFTPFLLLMFE